MNDLGHFEEREFIMATTDYEKPVWSYADSMGPAIYYGHIPEFNGLVPPYKGRQASGPSSTSTPSYRPTV